MLAERVERLSASSAPSVPNPAHPSRRVRGVLFDLDGTLYRQRPMRRLMAAELALLAIRHPLRAPAIWRVLSEFRRAQESMRLAPGHSRAADQIEVTAKRSGMKTPQVE